MKKQRPRNHTIHDLVAYAKHGLDYLITDHLDPKDGTNHKIHLSVCAEIIQDQLKEIYWCVNEITTITSFQVKLGC